MGLSLLSLLSLLMVRTPSLAFTLSLSGGPPPPLTPADPNAPVVQRPTRAPTPLAEPAPTPIADPVDTPVVEPAPGGGPDPGTQVGTVPAPAGPSLPAPAPTDAAAGEALPLGETSAPVMSDAPVIGAATSAGGAANMAAADASVDVFAYHEESLKPRPDLRVSLWCEDCGLPPAFSRTVGGGVAHFESLVPGRYKSVVYSPAGPVEVELEVEPGGHAAVRVPVPRDPYRPSDDVGRMRFQGYKGQKTLRQAEFLIASGGVLLAASAGMTVGAIIEANGQGCRYDDCGGAPRPRVIRGLSWGAGVTGVLSVAAFTVGAIRLKRYRFGGSAGPEGAQLSLSGTF